MLNQPGGYLLSRCDCLRFGLGSAIAGVSGTPVLTLGDETPKPQSAPKSAITLAYPRAGSSPSDLGNPASHPAKLAYCEFAIDNKMNRRIHPT